jgi:hypothetical protein
MVDNLQALSDQIKSDKEERTNYSLQSLFRVGDLHCITLP